MGFLKFLKWMFSKNARYVPVLTLSDEQDEEGPQLFFGCEGNYYSVCYEILERLCAEKYVAAWVKNVFWRDESDEKKRREITYRTTFPMYYAQEIAAMDDLNRMYGNWREMISVRRGFDRPLLSALIETYHIHMCDNRLYVLDETPPVCRTLSDAQALRELPCRFTAEYTPYDGALIFRNIASETVRQEIIQTVQNVCRAYGEKLTLYLKDGAET